ncbi:MAG: hypothetical protein MRZ45_08605 [Blautia sp.]|nr:hypothetical protein [Blautia sp.]
MKMEKLSHEEIADVTGLTLEEVKALEEEIMHLVWLVQQFIAIEQGRMEQ